MNPYSFAQNIINASEELIRRAKDEDSTGWLKKEDLAILLILLEICLDQSRSVAPERAASEYPEEKKHVEQSLDNLRKEISKLVRETDKKKLETLKQQTASEIKTNFNSV